MDEHGHEAFDKDYWAQRWQHEMAPAPGSMGTNPPNPYLAREVGELEPGTALDAGCGAGAESIWLAAHGWRVTAADISTEALARAAERAAKDPAAAERLRWLEADLSTWTPDCLYDLVMTHYAHPAIPQLDFYQRIGAWVAPGGTLLIVGHLHTHEAPEAPEAASHGHHPPAEASADAASITARLDESSWEIVTAEESTRSMPGRDDAHGSLRDVVVRVTRRR